MKIESVEKELDGKERELEGLLGEELDLLSDCQKCKQCLLFCPTYEGWYTQGTVGRLMAIYYHFKYGLGSEEELSDLLFACTTCRRCQTVCKLMATGVKSTDIIVKARNLLIKRAQAREAK